MAMERYFFFLVMLGIALFLGAPAALSQEKDKEIPAKEGDKIEAEADGKKSKKVTVKKKGVFDVSDLPPAESDRRCTRDESRTLKWIIKNDQDFGKELSKKLRETKSLRDRLHYLLQLAPEWERRVDLVEFSYRSGGVMNPVGSVAPALRSTDDPAASCRAPPHRRRPRPTD